MFSRTVEGSSAKIGRRGAAFVPIKTFHVKHRSKRDGWQIWLGKIYPRFFQNQEGSSRRLPMGEQNLRQMGLYVAGFYVLEKRLPPQRSRYTFLSVVRRHTVGNHEEQRNFCPYQNVSRETSELKDENARRRKILRKKGVQYCPFGNWVAEIGNQAVQSDFWYWCWICPMQAGKEVGHGGQCGDECVCFNAGGEGRFCVMMGLWEGWCGGVWNQELAQT